jgi:hypothetical protein
MNKYLFYIDTVTSYRPYRQKTNKKTICAKNLAAAHEVVSGQLKSNQQISMFWLVA